MALNAGGGSKTTVAETTMTCLFCRCNTWANKHGLASIKSKHERTRPLNRCPSQLLQKSPHHDLTQENISYILQSPAWVISPIQALSAGLPAAITTIIHASLFIHRGQGSATMTTGASDCRPPINKSDTHVFVWVGLQNERRALFVHKQNVSWIKKKKILWPNAVHKLLFACELSVSLACFRSDY